MKIINLNERRKAAEMPDQESVPTVWEFVGQNFPGMYCVINLEGVDDCNKPLRRMHITIRDMAPDE